MGSLLETPKPSIVIVPGSFSPPSFYARIIEELSSHGYEALTVDLPSVGRRDPMPPAVMAEDAAYIQSTTSKLADEGKDILVVTHSYGGICGTESLMGLTKAERGAEGKNGGITRILYITSLIPPVGKSLKELMGDLIPEYLSVKEDYMSHDPKPSGEITFSDLPEAEGLEMAKQMPEHSTISFAGRLTHAGYKDVDVSYLLCEQDKILPLEFQQGMIDMMESETGKKVDVHRLSCGHCPNASVPGKVVGVIRKASGERI